MINKILEFFGNNDNKYYEPKELLKQIDDLKHENDTKRRQLMKLSEENKIKNDEISKLNIKIGELSLSIDEFSLLYNKSLGRIQELLLIIDDYNEREVKMKKIYKRGDILNFLTLENVELLIQYIINVKNNTLTEMTKIQVTENDMNYYRGVLDSLNTLGNGVQMGYKNKKIIEKNENINT